MDQNIIGSRVRWHTPAIPVLRKLRQQDKELRTVWATGTKPPPSTTKSYQGSKMCGTDVSEPRAGEMETLIRH